jgi:hypothetical protein
MAIISHDGQHIMLPLSIYIPSKALQLAVMLHQEAIIAAQVGAAKLTEREWSTEDAGCVAT